ncbi:MAG: acyltransferase [Clostridia bacterium]|nr:acyltransferase [Clostridia bacterium]
MNPIRIWLDDARRNPDTRYVDTCDGIRAMAIMLVAWFHIWQQSWLYPGLDLFGRHISFDPLVRSGYIWVDVMILISGFCHYLPWARMNEGDRRPHPVDFYAKRMFRIHPSYMLTIIVMFAVAMATGAYYSEKHLRVDLLSHMTYTHTFFYNAYYATNLGGSLWTLAIELQFYLIFPWLAREFKRSPLMTFLAMVFGSLAFRAWVGANYTDVSMYFNQLPAYLDTFALGMAGAAIHQELAKRRHSPVQRIICSALCFVSLVLLWRVVKGQSASSGVEMIRINQMNNRMAMGCLGCVLLVCSANAGLLVRKLFANPLTRFISAVSMQFYIWHQTIAVWLLKYRVIPSEAEHPNYEGDLRWQILFTAACFLVSFAVSAVLTYGFERPAAKWLQGRWNAWRAQKRMKAQEE